MTSAYCAGRSTVIFLSVGRHWRVLSPALASDIRGGVARIPNDVAQITPSALGLDISEDVVSTIIGLRSDLKVETTRVAHRQKTK